MINTLYKFEGEIVAVSPLAVNRPDDNFVSARGSEHLRRLPRSGIKQDNTSVYFPATTLRRLFRESAYNVAREAMQRVSREPPFALSTHMMLSSGIDITNCVQHESVSGRVDGETSLRNSNPLLSLFGRWKLAGRLHVGNAIPEDNSCVYIEGAGARQNDFERRPELAELLPAEDAERLRHLLMQEVLDGPDIDAPSLQPKERGKRRGNKGVKNESGDKFTESARRPLEGFEAIRAGTILRHVMRLDCSTSIELGLLLAALREASRRPLVGAHRNLGCGEIAGSYDVLSWPFGANEPVLVGSVRFGFDEFALEGEQLVRALNEWDSKAKDVLAHFDFNRYLINDQGA